MEVIAAEMVARGARAGQYVTAQEVVSFLTEDNVHHPIYESRIIRHMGEVDREIRKLLRQMKEGPSPHGGAEMGPGAQNTPTTTDTISTAFEFLQAEECKDLQDRVPNGPLSAHPEFREFYGLPRDAAIPNITTRQVRVWLREWAATLPEKLNENEGMDGRSVLAFKEFLAKRIRVPGPDYLGLAMSEVDVQKRTKKGIEALGWGGLVEGIVDDSVESKESDCDVWKEGNTSDVVEQGETSDIKTETNSELEMNKEVEVVDLTGDDDEIYILPSPPRNNSLSNAINKSRLAKQEAERWRHSVTVTRQKLVEKVLERARAELEEYVNGGGNWLIECYNVLSNSAINRALASMAKHRAQPSMHPSNRPVLMLCIAYARIRRVNRSAIESAETRLRISDSHQERLDDIASIVNKADADDSGNDYVMNAVAGVWEQPEAFSANLAGTVLAVAVMMGLDLVADLARDAEPTARQALRSQVALLPPNTDDGRHRTRTSSTTIQSSKLLLSRVSPTAHDIPRTALPSLTRVKAALRRAINNLVNGPMDVLPKSKLGHQDTSPKNMAWLADVERHICVDLGVERFDDLGIEESGSFESFIFRHYPLPPDAVIPPDAFRQGSRPGESIENGLYVTDAEMKLDNIAIERPETPPANGPADVVPPIDNDPRKLLKVLNLKDVFDLAHRLGALSFVRHLASENLIVPQSLDPVVVHVTRPDLDLMRFIWQCARQGLFLDKDGSVIAEKKKEAEEVLGAAVSSQYSSISLGELGLGMEVGFFELLQMAAQWKTLSTQNGGGEDDRGVYEVALFCSTDLRHMLTHPSGNSGRFNGGTRTLLPTVGSVNKYHAALMDFNADLGAREAVGLLVHRYVVFPGVGSPGRGDLEAMIMATKDFMSQLPENTVKVVLMRLCSNMPGWLKDEFVEAVVTKVITRGKWKEWTDLPEVVPRRGGATIADDARQNLSPWSLQLGQEHRAVEHRISGALSVTEEIATIPGSVATNAEGSLPGTHTAIPGSVDDPRSVVDDIRRSQFGIGVEDTSPEVQRVLRNQRERVERALKRLGTELYSSDAHFALELIQNADDNRYNGLSSTDLPKMQFVLTDRAIVIRNNEDGFTATDMRSLCDVGKSTKEGDTGSFIGRKGVGFKSVYRLTSTPEIHSNGFHVRFDDQSFVIPQWIETDSYPLPDDHLWRTKIVLPLPQITPETIDLMSKVLDPRILIFLRKLKCIEFVNQLPGSAEVLVRSFTRAPDPASGIVEVTSANATLMSVANRWLVVKKAVDMPAWSQRDIDLDWTPNADLALAFSLIPPGDPQPAFAYLPLRTYGFQFIVQGDFAVPSSREDIDSDHPRNVLLRNYIPHLFVEAFERWIGIPKELLHAAETTEAMIEQFMSFVPDFAEGFMRPIVPAIQSAMRTACCIVTSDGDRSVPADVLQPTPEISSLDFDLVRLIPSNILQEITGKRWINFSLNLGVSASRILGVKPFDLEHLVAIIGSPTIEQKWEMYAILARVVEMRCKGKNAKLDLDLLRKTKLFTLADGRRAAPEENIFFPEEPTGASRSRRYEFLEELRVVNWIVFPPSGVHRTSIDWLLEYVGIKRRDPHDIIQHYIIPGSRTRGVESVSVSLSFIRYIKDHTSVCDMCMSNAELFEQLGDVLLLPTTDGWCHCRGVNGIYLPTQLGGIFELSDADLIDIVLLDPRELIPVEDSTNDDWRRFLEKIGCHKWLTAKGITRVAETKEDLPDLSGLDRTQIEEGPWTVEDYQCGDLKRILTSFSEKLPSVDEVEALKVLGTKFTLMCDQQWSSTWSHCKMGTVRNKIHPDRILYHFPSTMVHELLEVPWMPSTDDSFARSRDLFLPTEVTRSFVGDMVPYCPHLADPDFVATMGVKVSVSVADVTSILDHTFPEVVGQLRDDVIDNDLMRRNFELLRFLVQNMDSTSLGSWSSKPIVYVPPRDNHRMPPHLSPSAQQYPVVDQAPLLRAPSLLFWADPALVGQFDGYFVTSQTLQRHYNKFDGAEDVFVKLGVKPSPPAEMYVEALRRIASVGNCERAAVVSAQRICEVLTRELLLHRDRSKVDTRQIDPWKPTNSQTENDQLLKIKMQLLELPLFPSHHGKWVSLTGASVFINDDPQVAEQLFDPSLHFLFSIPDHTKSLSVTPSTIRSLLDALGVRRLTQAISTIPNTEGAQFNDTWDNRLARVIPFMQRYLCHFRSTVYHTRGAALSMQLANMQVFTSPFCGVRYRLDGFTSDLVLMICALSGIDTNDVILMIDESSQSDFKEIFLNLTRLVDPSKKPDIELADFLAIVSEMSVMGAIAFCHRECLDELPQGEPRWARAPRNPILPDEPPENTSVAPLEENNIPSRVEEMTANVVDLTGPDSDPDSQELSIVDAELPTPVDFIDVDADNVGGSGKIEPAVRSKRRRLYDAVQQFSAAPPEPPNPLDELREVQGKLWGPVTINSVGRLGEFLVNKSLQDRYAGNHNVEVKWLNEMEESGERWDILVTTKNDGGSDSLRYIEVKTTRGRDKNWFEISHRELLKAIEEGPNFTVVRVFLDIRERAGTGWSDFKPTIVELDNFESLFRQGKVKLRAEMLMAAGFFGNWRRQAATGRDVADLVSSTSARRERSGASKTTFAAKTNEIPDTNVMVSPAINVPSLFTEEPLSFVGELLAGSGKSNALAYLLTPTPPMPPFLSHAFEFAGIESEADKSVALASRNRQILAIRGTVVKTIRRALKETTNQKRGTKQGAEIPNGLPQEFYRQQTLIQKVEDELLSPKRNPQSAVDALEKLSNVLSAAIETSLLQRISSHSVEKSTGGSPTVDTTDTTIKAHCFSALAHLIANWPDLSSRISPFSVRNGVLQSDNNEASLASNDSRSPLVFNVLPSELRLVLWQAVLIPHRKLETTSTVDQWCSFVEGGVDSLAFMLLSGDRDTRAPYFVPNFTHLFSSHSVRSTIRTTFFRYCFYFLSSREYTSPLSNSYAFVHLLESLVAFFYFRINLSRFGDSRKSRRRYLQQRFEASPWELLQFAAGITIPLLPILFATNHLDPNLSMLPPLTSHTSTHAGQTVFPTEHFEFPAIPPHRPPRPTSHVPLFHESSLARTTLVVGVAQAFMNSIPSAFNPSAEEGDQDSSRVYNITNVSGTLDSAYSEVLEAIPTILRDLYMRVSDGIIGTLAKMVRTGTSEVEPSVEWVVENMMNPVSEVDATNCEISAPVSGPSSISSRRRCSGLPIRFLADLPHEYYVWCFDQIVDGTAPRCGERFGTPKWRLLVVMQAILTAVVVERWNFWELNGGIELAQSTYSNVLMHLVARHSHSNGSSSLISFPEEWKIDFQEARRKSVAEREYRDRRRRDAERRWAREDEEDEEEERRWAIARAGVDRFRKIAIATGKAAAIIYWWKSQVKPKPPTPPPTLASKPMNPENGHSDDSELDDLSDSITDSRPRRRKNAEQQSDVTYPDWVTRVSVLHPGGKRYAAENQPETVRMPNSIPKAPVRVRLEGPFQRDVRFTDAGEQVLSSDAFGELVWTVLEGIGSVVGYNRGASPSGEAEWRGCLDAQKLLEDAEIKVGRIVYGNIKEASLILNELENRVVKTNDVAQAKWRVFLDSEMQKESKRWRIFAAKVEDARAAVGSHKIITSETRTRPHSTTKGQDGAEFRDPYKSVFSGIGEGIRESEVRLFIPSTHSVHVQADAVERAYKIGLQRELARIKRSGIEAPVHDESLDSAAWNRLTGELNKTRRQSHLSS
ncbi:hypothetical protein HDU93_001473 [Gonapodya sp. JEL0774]|nr:hypothetical protein HDU93_001473 [Gonapodya sp. JEL0774]